MATLTSVFLGCRIVFFFSLIVCNAVITSLSGWNLGLVDTGHKQIAAYLFGIGIIGMVIIVPLFAFDLYRKNAVVNRVWFECLWVGLLWVFELAGAAALTADHISDLTCAPDVKNICVTLKVLQAFSWLCTVLLSIYLLVLVGAALYHQKGDKQVWHSAVRHYPWFLPQARTALERIPPSPTRTWKKPLHLGDPDAKHPVRQATLTRPSKLDLEYGYTSKLDPEHGLPVSMLDLEHVRPPVTVALDYSKSTAQRFEESYSAPRPAPVPQRQQVPQQAPSLYPEHLRSHLPSHTQVPSVSTSSPPPLGDWPRSQPQRRTTADRQTSSSSSSPSTRSIDATPYAIDPAGRPRPTHPSRKGSDGSTGSSRQRPIPPPLDLTRISAHRLADERVSRR